MSRAASGRSFTCAASSVSPKVDKWLVKTTGGLIAAAGAALLAGAFERPRSRALSVLGLGSAFALAAADVVYVARRRISPIYLADAGAQAAVCGLWLTGRTP
jgi:hypothetical protein